MFNKIVISEFFTTVSFTIFLRTLWLLTYKLPFLRYWNYNQYVEDELLWYTWNVNSKIIGLYNWRSAIYHALKMIWVTKNDEVIVNWYTCISVSNAVIQSWAKIIYSDINNKNLWFNISELTNNITQNTKVIIVQHTFWKPAFIKEIIELAKENGILIIEDCALSLWSRVKWEKLWSLWDFSIFSTWRDKVISSVTWWFLIINNTNYFKNIKKIKDKLKMPSRFLTIKNLSYNILAYISYKFYNILNIWKFVIFISRKLNLITEILSSKEKKCHFNDFNYKLPNSLAYLASKELEKIKFIRTHRRSIWEYYDELLNNKNFKPLFKRVEWEKNNYFRYPIVVKNEKIKKSLYNYMKNNNIILGNSWSGTNIVPIWSSLTNAQYDLWSCPVAEDLSRRILTLPNHNLVSFDDITIIVNLLNKFKN